MTIDDGLGLGEELHASLIEGFEDSLRIMEVVMDDIHQ